PGAEVDGAVQREVPRLLHDSILPHLQALIGRDAGHRSRTARERPRLPPVPAWAAALSRRYRRATRPLRVLPSLGPRDLPGTPHRATPAASASKPIEVKGEAYACCRRDRRSHAQRGGAARQRGRVLSARRAEHHLLLQRLPHLPEVLLLHLRLQVR